MNLSWSPFSQSSSVRCSITPPAAEPALLTMMSTRPSALCPCSMKFLASASLVRSAGMAMILRPVSLAISAAAASSGSLRRAQIATSTPSLASASAMPLPMPSLPPVTSAILPLSLRSIATLPLYFFMRQPAAGFGRGEQIGERGVERGRLFRLNVVARARDHQQAGGRRGALEEHAAVDARLVLVADDHQKRHREALEPILHLPQGRTLELEIEHGLRMAKRGMLGQHAREFGVAARVLVLQRLPHRRIGIFRRSRLYPLLGEHLAGFGGKRLHLFALLGVGRRAPAAAGGDHPNTARRRAHADMRCGVGAHRVPDHVRFVDFVRIHKSEKSR